MIKFLNSYITLLVILSFAYILAFYLANIEVINNAYLVADTNKLVSYFGSVSQTLIGLFLAVLIMKFLLGTLPFQNAIKNIFKEIFMEHDFLSGAGKSTLLSIADNIHKANNSIEFTDKTNEINSIKALERFFLKGNHTFNEKNHIVLFSDYTTTLLSTGVEIAHRKICCKVMKEGRFEFSYRFIPSDKVIDINRYMNNSPGERFNDYAYKELLTTTNPINAHDLKSEFSVYKDEKNKEDEEWIRILFTKFRAEVDEIITLEFSISSKFSLTKKEDIEEHFASTYTYPHAVRNIKFQLEHYKDYTQRISPMVPHLIIGTENAKEKFVENIYYKSYSWQINYAENQNKDVKFKVV